MGYDLFLSRLKQRGLSLELARIGKEKKLVLFGEDLLTTDQAESIYAYISEHKGKLLLHIASKEPTYPCAFCGREMRESDFEISWRYTPDDGYEVCNQCWQAHHFEHLEAFIDQAYLAGRETDILRAIANLRASDCPACGQDCAWMIDPVEPDQWVPEPTRVLIRSCLLKARADNQQIAAARRGDQAQPWKTTEKKNEKARKAA